MCIYSVDASTRVINALQELLAVHPPFTKSYHVAERALDLAFNGSYPLATDTCRSLLTLAEITIDAQTRASLLHVPEQARRSKVLPVGAESNCGAVSSRGKYGHLN